jgi:hypothetical protein
MRVRSGFRVLSFACLAALATAQAKPFGDHAMKPSNGFEQLTPLAGEWEGTTADGRAVRLSYELASGGTALLERQQTGDEPEMITVYTPDGDRLYVTHFCSAGNQPQMRTPPFTGATKQFSFSLVRVTNLAGAGAGHMEHLILTLLDRDHFTQEWTWMENGKSKTETFRFTRK